VHVIFRKIWFRVCNPPRHPLSICAITSLRDADETARSHGYQINLFTLSLFQLKDEPEGKGKRQLRKAPFLF
jgi:hypothetical protein